MEYLKKTGMYKVMKNLLPEVKIPLMKNCTYKFYRGSEWLECYAEDDEKYRMDRCGDRIEIVGTKTVLNEPTQILRRIYYLNKNGEYIKEYDRKGGK